MSDWIEQYLMEAGAKAGMASGISTGLLLLLLFLLALLANLVARRLLLRAVHAMTRKTRTTWDDLLADRGVFTRLSHLLPVLVLYHGATLLPSPGLLGGLQRFALAYMVGVICWSLHAFLLGVQDIYNTFPGSRSRPITGYIQTLTILLHIAAAIFMLAILLDRSPLAFLTGLGALSAVLMLIFRDSILGLVAGVQITANDMVRLGDWIEMPKYGADGDVIDISLHTVKVRNWDLTITTIPAHALIADSFKNWRGMHEAGGRRIKRALAIDTGTVQFIDEELLERLSHIQLLADYLQARRGEVDAWNEAHGVDRRSPVNGRCLTNVGTFRAYIEAYLRSYPGIHQDGMTFLVRQLAPTEKGLPIEIYVYTRDTRWVFHEKLQADIFDHLIAAVPLFDLALYQAPGSQDVRKLAEDKARGAVLLNPA